MLTLVTLLSLSEGNPSVTVLIYITNLGSFSVVSLNTPLNKSPVTSILKRHLSFLRLRWYPGTSKTQERVSRIILMVLNQNTMLYWMRLSTQLYITRLCAAALETYWLKNMRLQWYGKICRCGFCTLCKLNHCDSLTLVLHDFTEDLRPN